MAKPKVHKVGPVRTAIFKALGIPLSLTDPEGWPSVVGRDSPAGVHVSTEKMLTLSAVWGCTRLISETIATLPLSMYEKTSKGKRVATSHPLQMVLHDQPNADTTAAVHWEATVAAMLLRGNGRCEKLMSGNRVIGLQFLSPDRLSASRRADGKKEYRYTEENGKQRVIPPDRIWTIPGFSLDGKCGVSVIRYCAAVMGNALAADRTAASIFKSGLKPTRFLKLKTFLTKKQREEYRQSIDDVKNSLDTGDVPVLEGDMDFGTIGMNPDDAQLLESRAFSVEEVCRWFRVPPWMVGHTEKSSSWGTGIEQQMIGFLTFTLGPWLRRIEQAISKDLLTPAERTRYYPKFAVEGLLRADSAARAAFYSVMVNNGIMTRDEVRELEDREPMGGNAAVLTVQTALAPLDSLGQSTDAQQARAALVSWLREPEQPTPG
jgi:HK97 family phage portal protein